MMKKIFLILLLLSSLSLRSQDKYDESAYLHLSTTNTLVGDWVYFSSYTLSGTGQLTDLSSLLYVELIDGNGQSRGQAKIELTSGRGNGKLFIPIELETGVYYLSAYTRWMKNDHKWFNQPITIINPYKSYSKPDSVEISTSNPMFIDQIVNRDSLSAHKTSTPLTFEVELKEESDVSIAVSRVNDLLFKNDVGSELTYSGEKRSSVTLYPEHQYGIVQGKAKLTDAWISSSFQSEEMEVDILKTDDYGNFVLFYDPSNITTGIGNLDLGLSLSDALEVYPEYYDSYPSFGKVFLNFTDSTLNDIKQRSINNQLMNAYSHSQNSDLSGGRFQFLPGDDVRVFVLDEFKRFSSMRDTFIELIFEVSASKNEENNELTIRSQFIGSNKTQKSPLILLDGVQVSGEKILTISPYMVEKIEIVTETYFIGGRAFHGIISVHTFKNDFGGQEIGISSLKVKPIQKIEKGSPARVDITKTRSPHLEELLYWDPAVNHEGGAIDIDFTTSDFRGLYELSIRGVSKSGKSINISRYFMIE